MAVLYSRPISLGITYLNISDNPIDNSAAEAIASLIDETDKCRCIQKINLDNTKIDQEGAQLIFEALPGNQNF